MIQQFLNIIPIILFVQLSVWALYIDRRSVLNQLLATLCALLAIENTFEYALNYSFYPQITTLLASLDIALWGMIFSLILFYLVFFVEHPTLSRKRVLVLLALPNTLLLINPLFIITPPSEFSFSVLSLINVTGISWFMFYYHIVGVVIIAFILYLLFYARYLSANYRIQKQAQLITKAFLAVIAFFIPLMVVWFMGITTPEYLSAYPEVVFFAVVIYAMSKYRAQTLSTSSVVSEMIEHASELTMVINPTGHILSVNNRIERFLGYKKQSVEKANVFDLIENRSDVADALTQIEYSANYSPNIEASVRMHNGQLLVIRLGITPIRNQFAEILGYYLIFYAPVDEVNKFDDLQRRYELSNREKEVAVLLSKDLSIQDIADRLFISLATVKTHANNIYRKTGTANKKELSKLVE